MSVTKRNIKRARRLSEAGSRAEVRERRRLAEAMPVEWDFDAHFFPYFFKSDDSLFLPVTKSFLPDARRKDDDILMQDFFIDLDLAGHRAWTSGEEAREVLSKVGEALEKSDLPGPTWAYTTEHGLRLVWSASEAVPVDEGEKILLGLMDATAAALAGLKGLSVDLSGNDWTRCFRLPKVKRDGTVTWEQPWFILLGPGKVCEIAQLPKLERRTGSADPLDVDILDASKPTDAMVNRTLFDKDGNLREETKEVLRKFRGHDVYGCLVYGRSSALSFKPLPEVGKRYPTMKKMVGSLIGYLMGWKDDMASPENVYALLYHWAVAMREQGFEKDPTDLLWDLIKYTWPREEARQKAAQEQHQAAMEKLREQAEVGEKLLDSLVRSVSEWSRLPEFVEASEGEKKEWILKHAFLISTKTSFFACLMRTGVYTGPDFKWSKDHIKMVAEATGIAPILEFTEPRGESFVRKPLSRLAEEYSSLLEEAIYDSTIEKPILEKGTVGYKLVLPIHRKLLEPQSNTEVQEWLRSFVSPDEWDLFRQWLKAAQNPSRPVPALVLVGPPSTGKSMLSEAIGQFLGYSIAADDEVLMGWSGVLKNTAYIILEEGLSNSIARTGAYAKRFKKLLSGAPMMANEKYGMQFVVKCLARMVINVNDIDEVLKPLFEAAEKTQDNLKAIAKRFVFIKVQESAEEFLNAKGNWQLTENWISEKILARHLQTLADEVQLDNLDRFQIQQSKEYFERHQEEIEAIVVPKELLMNYLIEYLNFYKQRGHDGIKWHQGTLTIRTIPFCEYLNKTDYARWNSTTPKAIGGILSLISQGKRAKLGSNRTRWRFLDLEKLRKYAKEEGKLDVLESALTAYKERSNEA